LLDSLLQETDQIWRTQHQPIVEVSVEDSEVAAEAVAETGEVVEIGDVVAAVDAEDVEARRRRNGSL